MSTIPWVPSPTRVTVQVKVFDPTESSGLRILGEMSYAELQERLGLAKAREAEKEEERRQAIIQEKRARQEELKGRVENIVRVRGKGAPFCVCAKRSPLPHPPFSLPVTHMRQSPLVCCQISDRKRALHCPASLVTPQYVVCVFLAAKAEAAKAAAAKRREEEEQRRQQEIAKREQCMLGGRVCGLTGTPPPHALSPVSPAC